MPRKTAATLEEQRNAIKKKYKRGKRERKVSSLADLTDIEIAVKKEAACFLKAGDFSYTYIGDALHTTKLIVKTWFEEPSMKERVLEIQEDYIDGAVTLLKTYAIELIEMLVEIARTTTDDKIAIQAITEALDRAGLAKVNKSESAVTTKSRAEVDITDKHGVLAAMKDASPERQQEVARMMEEALALAFDDSEREVQVTDAQSD